MTKIKDLDLDSDMNIVFFSSDGFSLVELIVVMAIIGILTLLASMTLGSRSQEAELRAVQQDIKVLSDASEVHLAQDKKYPTLNGEVANADKLVRALGGEVKREDLKALDGEGINKYVQSTKNELTEYALATKGKHRGQVFYLGDIVTGDGNAYHGQVGGKDIVSTPPIEYSHSELFAFISEIRAKRVNGDGKHYFTDDDMYEFKNAERQIDNDDDDAFHLQTQFNNEKKYIYVDLGSSELLAGDINAGYYGLVDAKDLFEGNELATEIGLTAGRGNHNSDASWLKFSINGKTIYKSIKSYRYGISWESIDNVGAVYGSKKVEKKGNKYMVRLMKGAKTNPAKNNDNYGAIDSEWNRLILPIAAATNNGNQSEYIGRNTVSWGVNFSNDDFGQHNNIFNKGNKHWTQESLDSSNLDNRILRGNASGPIASQTNRKDNVDNGSTYPSVGWSPVLELID